MVEVNQDVEKIKEEISTIQETVNAMRETIEGGKTNATDSKTKLEELQSELSSLKNDALEISNLNHYNKQKIIKINSELRETNELFKVEEKVNKKFMDFSSLFLCFILIPLGVIISSGFLIFGIEKLQIDEISKMFFWTILVGGLWLLSFWIIKKFLIWRRMLVLKKTYDKFYAVVVCFVLLIAVGILIREPNKDGMDNDTFLSIVSILYAVIPSVLIKPFLLDEKKIFVEESSTMD